MRETGTGQQLAQLLDCYVTITMMTVMVVVVVVVVVVIMTTTYLQNPVTGSHLQAVYHGL
jgi:heme/copper-type cytochrome/quinol oxidase subunit 2